MTVREYIKPMYKMRISIHACDEYAQKDFSNATNRYKTYYCHNTPVEEIKTKEEFQKILEYNVACVCYTNGGELTIEVGNSEEE